MRSVKDFLRERGDLHYLVNNPGLQPIHRQHWYRGFVDDMLRRGHTNEEIQEMLMPTEKRRAEQRLIVERRRRTLEESSFLGETLDSMTPAA